MALRQAALRRDVAKIIDMQRRKFAKCPFEKHLPNEASDIMEKIMSLTNLKRGAILALLGLAVAPVTAVAKDGHPPRPVFEELDANADGVLSREEIEARGAARFAESDTNGDGSLSKEEIIASMDKRKAERAERRVNRMIERLDANDDGVISQDELSEVRKRGGDRFERIDANDDGSVSKEEFEEAMAKARHRGPKRKN